MDHGAEFKMLHANWEVMWVVRHKGENHIIVKDFDRDFVGARELYLKVKKTNRKMVTLRCRNVGFPPPDRWRDMEPVYKKRKGKLVVVDEVMSEPATYVGKMTAYNRHGVWWCPYCMELRRFEKRAWAEVDGHLFSADPKYYCPMCDVSHSDAHVIRYNPIAQRLAYGKKSRGRGRKKRGRSRRK